MHLIGNWCLFFPTCYSVFQTALGAQPLLSLQQELEKPTETYVGWQWCPSGGSRCANGCACHMLPLDCPTEDGWNVKGEWERSYFLGAGIIRVVRLNGGGECRLCKPCKNFWIQLPQFLKFSSYVNHRNASPWEGFHRTGDWMVS